jgi:hypothetical protein
MKKAPPKKEGLSMWWARQESNLRPEGIQFRSQLSI